MSLNESTSQRSMARKKSERSEHPSSSTRASWDTASEAAFIGFLLKHKSDAGDGFNFKIPTFKAAAIHLTSFTVKGGAKTAASCKNKWARMKDIYLAVRGLMEQSGFAWNEKNGATITVELESVWEDYVRQFPLAGPFRNGGWSHFDDMMPLMPTTAKGANVFHAASQAVTATIGIDDSSDDNVDSGENDKQVTTSEYNTPKCDNDPKRDDANSMALALDYEIRRNWSLTPPPLFPSAPPAPPLERSHKRRHSAISPEPVTPGSTTPLTNTGHKKPRIGIISQADAITGLRSELASFSGTFLEGTSSMAPLPPAIAPSPSRKMKAIQRVQELEVDLDDERLVSLIRIFQMDVNAADAYMVLKRDGVRKM